VSVDDTRVVKKFLRVVPACYNQVAVTIEMFYDLKTLTVEDLVGRLRAAKDRFEPTTDQVTDKAKSQLLLTEEEWMAKNRSRMVNTDTSSSSGKSGGNYVKKDKQGVRSGKQDRDRRDSACHPSTGTPRRERRCKKCGVYGHWARECQNKKSGKEDHDDAAYHVAGDTDKNPALWWHRCAASRTPQG
jgi:hypothetical protein